MTAVSMFWDTNMVAAHAVLGTLSNDGDDDNNNVKK